MDNFIKSIVQQVGAGKKEHELIDPLWSRAQKLQYDVTVSLIRAKAKPLRWLYISDVPFNTIRNLSELATSRVVVCDLKDGGIVELFGEAGAGKSVFATYNMLGVTEDGEIVKLEPLQLKPASGYCLLSGAPSGNYCVLD